jgi:hypothetical protein
LQAPITIYQGFGLARLWIRYVDVSSRCYFYRRYQRQFSAN